MDFLQTFVASVSLDKDEVVIGFGVSRSKVKVQGVTSQLTTAKRVEAL